MTRLRPSTAPVATVLACASTFLVALALAPAISSPAAAQDQSPYEQCLAKAKGEAPTLACARTELSRQEARLKGAEAKLAPKVSAADKPLYAAANAAWRTFRDAQCAWDGASAPQGENGVFAETDCRIGITEARVNELEARAAPPDDAPEKQ